MRMVQLLRLAAQAETLRWRRMGRGYAVQAGFGAAAGIFALMLIVMLHIAAFSWLAGSQGAWQAALIVAVLDLIVAGVLGYLATRRNVDPIMFEAQRVRDDALKQVGDGTARAAILAPLLRSQSAKKGMMGAAVTAAVVGLISRR